MSNITSKKRIRVVYFITELNIGGAEKVLVHLLSGLDRSRFEPTMVCLYGGDSPIAAEIRALNLPVVDLGMTAKWRWDAFWRLYRLLRRECPIILHTSLFHANISGRVVGRLAGTPAIVTCRQNVNIGGKWREIINRWTARLDDKVIAVSELAREEEIEQAKVSPDKVVTIYNAIDVTAFSASNEQKSAHIKRAFGIPSDALLIGTVGRLHPQKGLAHLLDAIAQIKTQATPFQLLLVGDGELRDKLEAQAQSLKISDITIFAGARTDVPAILAELDIFAFPSQWEGLSLALLEAMAAGLPVVATAVGGTPEVVSDNETGFLVPSHNSTALAGAIETLLRDPALRHKMGRAGYERVRQHFTLQQMVDRTQNLYEELISQKGASYQRHKG